MLSSYLELVVNLDDGASRKIDKSSTANLDDGHSGKSKDSALN